MAEADYYPSGAYNDTNAPWNQSNKEPDYIEVPVNISISLSNIVTVCTNDYIPTLEEDYDVDIDPDGHRVVAGGKYESQDFSETNWNEAYIKDDCYILTLLKEYGEILKNQISEIQVELKSLKDTLTTSHNSVLKRKARKLKDKLDILNAKYNACTGYIVDDLFVEKN